MKPRGSVFVARRGQFRVSLDTKTVRCDLACAVVEYDEAEATDVRQPAFPTTLGRAKDRRRRT